MGVSGGSEWTIGSEGHSGVLVRGCVEVQYSRCLWLSSLRRLARATENGLLFTRMNGAAGTRLFAQGSKPSFIPLKTVHVESR